MKTLTKLGVAGLTVGTAARALVSKRSAEAFLVSRLSELPGVPAKIGQILGMRSEPQFGHEVRPCLSIDEVLTFIQAECPQLFADLETIEPEARVASLSQVHRGVLRDGRQVAIKVQFPGLKDEIIRQVQLAFEAFTVFRRGKKDAITIPKFERYFLDSLLSELDYRREANNQDFFRKIYSEPGSLIIVPEIYPQYSGDTLLTQEWIASQDLVRVKKKSSAERRQVSDLLFKTQIDGVFKHKAIHADLHPGNWGYLPNLGGIVLYDFGSVLRISDSELTALNDLFNLPRSASEDEFLHAYSKLGFDRKMLQPLSCSLGEITNLLAEPVRRQQWNPLNWNLGERLEQELGEEKWTFRMAGPEWFLSLMRSSQGLMHAMRVLDAAEDSEARSGKRAESLRIEICDNGRSLVSLEFPSKSAGNLDDLVSEETKLKIEREGISVIELSRRAVQSDFAPQTLFCGEIGTKRYKVWLE